MTGWISGIVRWLRSPETTVTRSLNFDDCEAHVSALRVELFYDDEAANWHYRVPALSINGGGVATRQEAEALCRAAIEFALEGDPRDYDTTAQAVTFEVRVIPAA